MNPAILKASWHLFEKVRKIIPSQTLDKVFRFTILRVVNPTALLRFWPDDGSFYLDESLCFYRWQ